MPSVSRKYLKFCRPTFYCESNSTEIKKLAKKIVNDSKSSEKMVKKIFLWVRDKIQWDITKVVGIRRLLKRKPLRGNCTDKVNLFIALCRSLKIPARYVFLYCSLKRKKKNLPKKVGHVIAEVLIDGKWVIADPTFGKHTKKLVEVSQLGKPSWKKAYIIFRTRGLFPLMVWIDNFLMPYSPSSRKLKHEIEKLKK